MAQHIRTQNKPEQMNGMPAMPAKPASMMTEPGKYIRNTMQRIRHSPRQMIGWIIFIIFILAIVVAVGGHYMRYWTIPKVSFIPQKPAPSSHLQYFFF